MKLHIRCLQDYQTMWPCRLRTGTNYRLVWCFLSGLLITGLVPLWRSPPDCFFSFSNESALYYLGSPFTKDKQSCLFMHENQKGNINLSSMHWKIEYCWNNILSESGDLTGSVEALLFKVLRTEDRISWRFPCLPLHVDNPLLQERHRLEWKAEINVKHTYQEHEQWFLSKRMEEQ